MQPVFRCSYMDKISPSRGKYHATSISLQLYGENVAESWQNDFSIALQMMLISRYGKIQDKSPK